MIRSSPAGVFSGVMVCAATASSASRPASLPAAASQATSSRRMPSRHGELRGIVHDEQGQPLAGAVVSALGSTSRLRCVRSRRPVRFPQPAAGPYLVRAHLQGYVPAAAATSRSRRTRPARPRSIALTRSSVRRTTARGRRPRRSLRTSTPAAACGAEHGHDEVAWRLRHLKRSVLKDAGTVDRSRRR